jgi:exodeoxyribonuclease V beta subunit
LPGGTRGKCSSMPEFNLCHTPIPKGLSIIEASAGTGKTWTLAHLLPRLIVEGRIQALKEALMVSFTEDSTRELSERARKAIVDLAQLLLKQDPRPSASPDLPGLIRRAIQSAPESETGLRQLLELLLAQPAAELAQRVRLILKAQLDCDRLSVSTIHALCRGILGDEAFLCGMPAGFEVVPDISEWRAQALRDTWRAGLAPDPVLALLAVREDWKISDDVQACRLVEPLEAPRFHPQPLSLPEAKAAFALALERVKACAAQITGLEAMLLGLGQENLNLKGKERSLQGWDAALAGMDCGAPESADLDRLAWLAEAKACVRATSKANKEAIREILALPLVQASQAAQGAILDLGWAWRCHGIQGARQRQSAALARLNALSYDDLIARLHGALQGPSGEILAQRLRARWKVALVDESQDTDPRQMAIFEALFNRRTELDGSLLLMGDPKQAIYGFRGADLQTYEDTRDREPKAPKSELSKTFRSAPGLVEALNALWDRPRPLASQRLELPKAIPAKNDADLPLPAGEAARFAWSLVAEDDHATWGKAQARLALAANAAAMALHDLLDKDGVLPGDCAVLTRTNAQATEVRDALRAHGIPSVLRDDGDVLHCDEAKELASLCRAALHPGSSPARRAALGTRLCGMDSLALAQLGAEEDESWLRRFADLGETWRRQGVAAFMARLDQEQGLGLRLAEDPGGERRLTDFRHLAEWLQAEEAEHRLAPERLLHRMESAMAEQAQGTPADARLQRLEQDGSAVQILTVHRSKGLQFPYVFCPYLWDARSLNHSGLRLCRTGPGRSLLNPRMLDDEERVAREAEADWDRLEEDLRLAYVALTRAERRNWVLAGWIGMSDGKSLVPPSALDWILRLGKETESLRDWYRRVSLQKKVPTQDERKRGRDVPFTCEHAQRLQELSGNPWVRVEPVSLGTRAWKDREGEGIELKARSAAGLVVESWRVTSFTGMTKGQEQARDVRDAPAEAMQEGLEGTEVTLARFPRGPQAGECLHQFLEHWDFNGDAGPGIRSALGLPGIAQALDAEAMLVSALPDLSQAVLPGLGSLAETARDASLSEWHFLLPLSAHANLARVFGRHPEPRMRAYAPALTGIQSGTVQGMLQGYIDRLARKGPLWTVVDWKSNHLGDHAGDYSQEALWNCATHSHYVLQAHLYMLALRRYLRLRAPGHRVLGAGLAFLRGMKAGSSQGILHMEAHEGFMQELEGLFQ